MFVPAGIGGVLTDEVIDALDARACAGRPTTRSPSGAAPNAWRSGGILYAPDFVVNAGGVIYLDLVAKQRGTVDQIMAVSPGSATRSAASSTEAAARGVTPLAAAEGLAAERLAVGARSSALV